MLRAKTSPIWARRMKDKSTTSNLVPSSSLTRSTSTSASTSPIPSPSITAPPLFQDHARTPCIDLILGLNENKSTDQDQVNDKSGLASTPSQECLRQRVRTNFFETDLLPFKPINTKINHLISRSSNDNLRTPDTANSLTDDFTLIELLKSHPFYQSKYLSNLAEEQGGSNFSPSDRELWLELQLAKLATEMALFVLGQEYHNPFQHQYGSMECSSDVDENEGCNDPSSDDKQFDSSFNNPNLDRCKLKSPTKARSNDRNGQTSSGNEKKVVTGPDGKPVKKKGRSRMSQEKRKRQARRKEREAMVAAMSALPSGPPSLEVGSSYYLTNFPPIMRGNQTSSTYGKNSGDSSSTFPNSNLNGFQTQAQSSQLQRRASDLPKSNYSTSNRIRRAESFTSSNGNQNFLSSHSQLGSSATTSPTRSFHTTTPSPTQSFFSSVQITESECHSPMTPGEGLNLLPNGGNRSSFEAGVLRAQAFPFQLKHQVSEPSKGDFNPSHAFQVQAPTLGGAEGQVQVQNGQEVVEGLDSGGVAQNVRAFVSNSETHLRSKMQVHQQNQMQNFHSPSRGSNPPGLHSRNGSYSSVNRQHQPHPYQQSQPQPYQQGFYHQQHHPQNIFPRANHQVYWSPQGPSSSNRFLMNFQNQHHQLPPSFHQQQPSFPHQFATRLPAQHSQSHPMNPSHDSSHFQNFNSPQRSNQIPSSSFVDTQAQAQRLLHSPQKSQVSDSDILKTPQQKVDSNPDLPFWKIQPPTPNNSSGSNFTPNEVQQKEINQKGEESDQRKNILRRTLWDKANEKRIGEQQEQSTAGRFQRVDWVTIEQTVADRYRRVEPVTFGVDRTTILKGHSSSKLEFGSFLEDDQGQERESVDSLGKKNEGLPVVEDGGNDEDSFNTQEGTHDHEDEKVEEEVPWHVMERKRVRENRKASKLSVRRQQPLNGKESENQRSISGTLSNTSSSASTTQSRTEKRKKRKMDKRSNPNLNEIHPSSRVKSSMESNAAGSSASTLQTSSKSSSDKKVEADKNLSQFISSIHQTFQDVKTDVDLDSRLDAVCLELSNLKVTTSLNSQVQHVSSNASGSSKAQAQVPKFPPGLNIR